MRNSRSEIHLHPNAIVIMAHVPGTFVTKRIIEDAKFPVLALSEAALAPFRSTIDTAPTVLRPYTNTVLPV